MCRGEPPLPTEVSPLARARFAGRADVTVSHPHSSSSSRRASPRAARSAGWRAGSGCRLGAVLAIGDQWNDIEMLAEVGHGAAMPTAPVEVQAVARYIAPPLAEEGVARIDRDARPGAGPRSASGGRRGWPKRLPHGARSVRAVPA